VGGCGSRSRIVKHKAVSSIPRTENTKRKKEKRKEKNG
jgi:hypothetical protein